MTIRDRITSRLTEALRPELLDVVDESSLHKGHAGARPEGETHFRIRIVAAAFRGLDRVAAHRLIYSTLADEIANGVHALAISASPPEKT